MYVWRFDQPFAFQTHSRVWRWTDSFFLGYGPTKWDILTMGPWSVGNLVCRFWFLGFKFKSNFSLESINRKPTLFSSSYFTELCTKLWCFQTTLLQYNCRANRPPLRSLDSLVIKPHIIKSVQRFSFEKLFREYWSLLCGRKQKKCNFLTTDTRSCKTEGGLNVGFLLNCIFLLYFFATHYFLI